MNDRDERFSNEFDFLNLLNDTYLMFVCRQLEFKFMVWSSERTFVASCRISRHTTMTREKKLYDTRPTNKLERHEWRTIIAIVSLSYRCLLFLLVISIEFSIIYCSNSSQKMKESSTTKCRCYSMINRINDDEFSLVSNANTQVCWFPMHCQHLFDE
jgi:hypothetical protein